MRVRAPLLTLLLVGPLLSGCSLVDREPLRPFGTFDRVPPATLPDKLCGVVPATVVTRWRLEEAAQESTADPSKTVGTCDMTGRLRGKALTLSLRVESRAGADEEAADARMEILADAECNDIRQIGYASGIDEDGNYMDDRYEEADDGCVTFVPGDRMITVKRSPRVHGVVKIDVDYRSTDGAVAIDGDVATTVLELGTLLSDLAVDDSRGTTGV